MARYLYLLLVNPKPGREEEWNRWHMDRHVVDILEVPGFVSCRRFRAASQQRNDAAARWQFLALYEMETDDPKAVFDEVRRRIATAAMPMSPASDPTDPENTVTILWEPISVHGKQAPGAGDL